MNTRLPNQPYKETQCIAQLKYAGVFSFSVCFSYRSQSFLDSYFVTVGKDATQEIRKDCPVFFEPALGGVVFNFESGDAREIVSGKGCFEVRPLSPITAAPIIARLFETSFRWGKNAAGVEKPKPFQKTESAEVRPIDPWKNACKATLGLLARDNPELAKAVKANKPSQECARAFVADVVRRLGIGPKGFSADDREYNRLMSEAWQQFDNRRRRKSKADIVDWHLAHPSNWVRYYRIKDPDQISQLVADETGTNRLSRQAIKKRMERLKLIRDCKRGLDPERQ